MEVKSERTGGRLRSVYPIPFPANKAAFDSKSKVSETGPMSI